MCGIAGIVDPASAPDSRAAAVGRMCAAMVHRGPDDSGVETAGEATLGMRRLAIFDPANGHQPMRTPDGRFTLVFNGAIYNFRELRDELSAAGWPFRTRCDTEVLLAAFARWGESCLGRLRGMFAFAVWDSRLESLFLARDPFGIKPLYYHHAGNRLLFGSEINALLSSRTFPAEIDPLSVSDYLAWFSVPAPRTIYRGVFGLRPAECATFHKGRLDIRSTWNFRGIPGGTPCASREEFMGGLRDRLRDSIRAHMLADVPVGVFLSGGLDSAVVAGLMTRAAGAPLKTFSVGFEEQEFSEIREAEATARHLGSHHLTRILAGKEVADEIETLLAAFDQPTGDGINTYYASETARDGGVTVALSGLGGDELFGGYPSFSTLPTLARWLPLWRCLPRGIGAAAVRRLRRGDTRHRKLADLLRHARDIHELAAMQRRVFSEPVMRSLLAPEPAGAFGDRPPHHPELSPLRADLDGAGPFEIASAWELRTYMADVLLRDSDVMSMRHSLELRVPFVDRPLIEWLWRQPPRFKYEPGRPKGILAEAAADVLPPHMAARHKRGFSLPFAPWMRRELKPFLDETFSDSSVDRSGLFKRSPVQSFWREFLDRRDDREWSRVWSLAVLIAFANRRTPAKSDPLEPSLRRGEAAAPETAPTVAQSARSADARPAHGSLTAAVSAGTRLVPPAPEGRPPEASLRDEPSARHLRAGALRPGAFPEATGNGARSAPSAPPAPRSSKAKPNGMTLLLAPELCSSVGGIPRILQLYLKALCDLAGESRGAVRLVALNDPVLDTNDLRRYATEDQLDDWVVCDRRKRRFVEAVFKLARGCDRIVCGHVAQLPVAWAARLFNPRLRYYLVAHGIEVWRSFGPAERIALRGARRVLCVSDYTRRELLRNCRLRPGRAVVLPNALDPVFAIENGTPLPECPPAILTVTRLSSHDRYKGVESLIRAMPEVLAGEPAARLRVVGRGDDLPRLQGIARQLGILGQGVEFLGYLDDRRLDVELRNCRLFALPSKKEGFGLVFLEAMAHGRPCLGARAGGIPEVITDSTGVLVEFGDVPGIANACLAALSKPWASEEMLARARHFDYGHFKDRLASFLNE